MDFQDFFNKLITYSFVGAAAVLLIMNAQSGTIPIAKTLFSGWNKETGLLTGSGYVKPK
jgi:hypothetical protein